MEAKKTRNKRARTRIMAGITGLAIALAGMSAVSGGAAHAAPSPYGGGWLRRGPTGVVSSASSTGVAPTLKRTGPGEYDVTFHGITGDFGVPDVTVGIGTPYLLCMVGTPTLTAGSIHVFVGCTNKSFVSADAEFTVSYTSTPGAKEGWALVGASAVGTEQEVDSGYSVNGDDITDDHWDTGAHVVRFEGIGSWELGGVSVSSLLPGRHCRIGHYFNEAPNRERFDISCFDKDGVRSDPNVPLGTPEFTVHWTYLRDPIPVPGFHATNVRISKSGVFNNWTPATETWSSDPHDVFVMHPSKGVWKVKFVGARGTKRFATVTPITKVVDARCNARAVGAKKNAIVRVLCVGAGGSRIDPEKVLVTYTTSPAT